MSCSNFYSVEAIATPDNVKSVYWRMAHDFVTKGRDLSFFIDVAEESLGDWRELNTGAPVIDKCVYIDTEKHRYNMVSDIWYRVRAVLTDPAGIEPDVVLESMPTQLQGALTDRAYLVAKAIIRSMYKKLKKGGGQQGFLLKRKIWGDRCPTCTDFDVETVLNAHCSICFGTGIVGGYHEGIEFWLLPSVVKGRQRKISEIGTQDDYDISGECVAYPWIDADDVWVDAKTNERFLITGVSHVMEMERKPVIYNLALTKIANTDVALEIPIADPAETFENENEVTGSVDPIEDKFPVTDTEVVKSDLSSGDKGWRRGLGGDDW